MDSKWLAAQFAQTPGKSQADLARFLDVHTSTVNKMVKGKRKISSIEADQIRVFFGATFSNSENVPKVSNDSRYANLELRAAGQVPTMREVHSWRHDVPVYGNAQGGASIGADIVLNGDTGIRVRRPPRLDGRVDIFALYVQGTSMEPRYYSGDLIYLEKAVPPRVGDFVVIECKPGPDGEQHALIKQYLGRSGNKLKLRQLNPDKHMEFDADKVLQMIRVMSLQDLMS